MDKTEQIAVMDFINIVRTCIEARRDLLQTSSVYCTDMLKVAQNVSQREELGWVLELLALLEHNIQELEPDTVVEAVRAEYVTDSPIGQS